MAWWKRLGHGTKDAVTVVSILLALLGGAFGLGAVTSNTVDTHKDLPARMDAAETKLTVHDTVLARLQRVDTVSQRNRAVLDTVYTAVSELQCIARAEVRGESAVRCLRTYGER